MEGEGEGESTFTRERQAVFLEALAVTGAVRSAAARAGVSHQTAYRARLACPVFARAWRAALLAARAAAEEVLATRAIDGVEEEVWYHGEVVATRRRYDSRLLLAHLARLDKLTEEAPVAAFAEDFDAALARFAAGSQAPEIEPAQEPSAPAEISSPGQWSKRSKPPEASPPAPCPDCGGKCLGPQHLLTRSDCQDYGNRIERMEDARPFGAKTPAEFLCHKPYDVEECQLDAFEQGVDEWWRIVPPGPGDDPEVWHYAE